MPLGSNFAETLLGTAANDSFTGLGGNDNFVFAGQGDDVITDFRSRYFTSTMTGTNQIPAVVTAATGTGAFILNGAQTALDVTLDVQNLSGNASGNHIHRGGAAVNGPIVFDMPAAGQTTFTINHVWTTGLAADLANLFSGNLYSNVHSPAHAAGEIRGQILAVAGDTGADRIDVSSLNIGGFDTIQQITADDLTGSAKISVTSNGVHSSMTLAGLALSKLTAADFIFAGAANETRFGTASADDLFGAGGNDTLRGLAGDDRLFGETGKDKLDGGLGADLLNGGSGKDTMTGGKGKDVFDFNSAKDSLKGSAHDQITDFKHGQDKIDLKDIDANLKKALDQKFTFIGAVDFHHVKGELHYVQIDNAGTAQDKTIVEGDITGDGRADFQIELKGLINLTKVDFVL